MISSARANTDCGTVRRRHPEAKRVKGMTIRGSAFRPEESNSPDLRRLLCITDKWRKRKAKRENDEPDRPHWHLGEDRWRGV
jgi:hypothetical protein